MTKTPDEIVREHDKEKRIKAEEEIRGVAKSLTNGNAGDPQKTGIVLLWLVENSIDNNELLRTMVDDSEKYQTLDGCEETMSKCPAGLQLAKKKSMHPGAAVGFSAGGIGSVWIICQTVLKVIEQFGS